MGTDENDEYTKCFKFIIFVMKMFAVYPFFPLKEVMNISNVFSTILTMISVSLFAWANFNEQQILWYANLFYAIGSFDFMKTLKATPKMLTKFLFLAIPWSTWNKNKQLINYRNNWKRFQIEIEKLTSSSNCSLKYKVQCIFASGILIICVMFASVRKLKWNGFLTNAGFYSIMYMMHGLANLMTYWIVDNTFTASFAKKIINSVQRCIAKERDKDLLHLIDLWMTLCDLKDEFIAIHTNLFLLLFYYLIVIGTVGTYLTIFTLVNFLDKSITATYFFVSIILLICTTIFCESAHTVTKYMVHELRKTLLDENVNIKNKKLKRVTVLFLQTIETRNPQMNFNRFMTIGRSVLCLIIGTSINFLVILKQFSLVR